MAHLLMIESWVFSTAYLLPSTIDRLGHRFTFLTRDLQHYLKRSGSDGVHPLLTAENIVRTETNDLDAVLATARRLHEAFHFDGVLTACDYYLDAVALVAAELGLPGMPPRTVDTARTKHLMRAALDRAGLPNPSWHLATDWDETLAAARRIGYPVVLKPVDLCAGMFVTLVADDSTLRRDFERLAGFSRNARQQERPPRFLVEEYLPGDEVSVETYTFDGETRVIGLTDKALAGFPHFVEVGHQFPAALDEATARAACDLAVGALAAVGYTQGMGHIEVKLTPRGPRIVEINPRVGGNYIFELIARVRGLDTLEMLVDLALGRRPSLEPCETGVRSAAIRLLTAPRDGRIAAVGGIDALERDPNVARWELRPLVGSEVTVARDNNNYLGHVVSVDRAGLGARAHAERAAGWIELLYADQTAA